MHIKIELRWDKTPTQQELESPIKCPTTPSGFSQIQRNLDRLYTRLPWPQELSRIGVMTEVQGGRGDVSAAAKAIRVMQRMCPHLHFHWILSKRHNEPESFLKDVDLTKITFGPTPASSEPAQVDFLLNGPVRPGWGTDYIEAKFNIRVKDSLRFNFLESADPSKNRSFFYARSELTKTAEDPYAFIHKIFFCNSADWNSGIIMGLQEGAGIFLDESRISAPLSCDSYCPSYLFRIEDESLKTDILAALEVPDDAPLENYGKSSLNSGYAHHVASWGKFIEVVAIHEKQDMVIVLNQEGEYAGCSTEQFSSRIFTPERLAFLNELGVTTISIKGAEKDPIILQDSPQPGSRKLRVILRPSFKPNDMKWLQLASERLLATGGNTPAEAWAARCKLYVYEDVANGGCTKEFLEQQIALANTVSPNLANLLQTFGTHLPFSQDQLNALTPILQDPSLSEQTLQFCHLITQNYSFDTALESALKRAAWHHILPDLPDLEAAHLDPITKEQILAFISSPTTAQTLTPDLSSLAARIHTRILSSLPNA